jgi:acyl-CoA synthetase (AMP-forming)/AMP-acid ligase II
MRVNVGSFLTERARINPDAEGLVCGDTRRSFGELNQRANRLAQAMLAFGLRPGERVAALAYNEAEYYDLFFGLGKMGAVLTPINYRLAGPEAAFIVNDCSARVLVVSPELVEVVDSVRSDLTAEKVLVLGDGPPPDWAESYDAFLADASDAEPELVGGGDDTLTILYTSGTTGRPKGAELTHDYYFWSGNNLTSTVGTESGMINLIALPLFHIGALAGPPWLVYIGGKCVLLRTFDPQRFLELLQEERITGFGSVPALLQFLKFVPEFDRYDWSSVKVILVYAAPVPVGLIREYEASGIKVRQLYGLTEFNTATVLGDEHALTKVGSCGRPFFHTEIRLLDLDGRPVGVGEIGEVVLRGPNMLKSYWHLPDATAEAIRDGWLHTGDMATVDQDGFYYIQDRKKDMIISGGENIYPAEIESYLLEHPVVLDVAVIGYPHETWGEAVKAVVVPVPEQSLTEAELIEWCRGRMGRYKIPKTVVFTDQIPRTPTGKILKRALRDQFN